MFAVVNLMLDLLGVASAAILLTGAVLLPLLLAALPLIRLVERRRYDAYRRKIAGTIPAPDWSRYDDPNLLHGLMYDWQVRNISTFEQMLDGPMQRLADLCFEPTVTELERHRSIELFADWTRELANENSLAEHRAKAILLGRLNASNSQFKWLLDAFEHRCTTRLEIVPPKRSAAPRTIYSSPLTLSSSGIRGPCQNAHPYRCDR